MRTSGTRTSALDRLALLLLLLGAMAALRAITPPAAATPAVQSATVALGFLLLAAYLAGQVTASLGLPRITGYILLGFLVGPGVLGLVTGGDVGSLRLIDDIAISLIALSAGGEIRIAELRRRGRTMGFIMAWEMIAVFVVIAGAVLLLAPLLPFAAGLDLAAVAVIALIFGSIAIANSPSVAIAVINDTRSRGPVASTVLGVTVLKDVAVILLFAVALSVARAVMDGGRAFQADALFLRLSWEVGGSVLVGALSGWLIGLYLRRVRVHLVLFALALAFLNAQIAAWLHLEVLVLSLTAGFFLENVSPAEGEPFVQAVEANSLPLYALFFSLAGAGLHLGDLASLWPFVAGFVLLRAAAIFAGTWTGARLAGAEPEVRRYAWLGFVSQAGVTLGMVAIAARAFPEWGADLRTLFVTMVAVHELVGPVLLQHGLRRAGEVGAREASAGRTVRAVAPAAATTPASRGSGA